MKTFHCTHCQNLIFFENVQCLHCGHALAFLPDKGDMAAMVKGSDDLWSIDGPDAYPAYRLCANYTTHQVCNWAVPSFDPEPLCQSCRLTRTIPDLSESGTEAWFRLETAKRRLLHCLFSLGLPVNRKDTGNPDGIAFEFLRDSTSPDGDHQRVLTGHDNGLITINIEEADDVQRERARVQQHEPYRTVLGHLRHEIGHYYWDRLIQNGPRLAGFREVFGDEREDYAAALKRHYEQGPPPAWQERYVSSYATAHPWEDWAESWAHFLHMTDALETANSAGLSLQPPRSDEPVIVPPTSTDSLGLGFNEMIARWLPLAYVMNNLSRGLGHADIYPFVLSPIAIGKLRFIHETILDYRNGGG